MPRLITLQLSYYNQPAGMLRKHIESWIRFEPAVLDKFSFTIVDDCSRVPVDQILQDIDMTLLSLKVYRVQVDLTCNIAGVRNLAAQECDTSWMVILDMDTVVTPVLAKFMVETAEANMEKPVAFNFNRVVPGNPRHIKHNKMHPAVCLIRRVDYWSIGGCEEDLVGSYGYTDPCFWHRAIGKVTRVPCRNQHLLYYPEGESDICRDRSRNAQLFKTRTQHGGWSTSFVRFPWTRLG